MSGLKSSSLYRGRMVMRSVSKVFLKSRRTACLLLAVLPSTNVCISVAWSAEPVGARVESQVLRVQPQSPRLSDQNWFQLVHNKGAKFGLGAYAKRIFVTSTGRYYVPVDQERAAIRAVQRTAAGQRLAKRFAVYPTAVMPYNHRASAPSIATPSITRRPARAKTPRAYRTRTRTAIRRPLATSRANLRGRTRYPRKRILQDNWRSTVGKDLEGP